MAIKTAIILIALSLASSSAQILSRNSLQNIISPGNSENLIQLIKSASTNRCPKAPRAVYDLPGNARIISLPGNARILPESCGSRVIASEYPTRTIRDPRMVNDCAKVINPVVRDRDSLIESLVIPREIFQSLAVAAIKEPAKVCQPPAAYNPYLPVASPVSATAPLNMPPPIQSRGHFLRKIPIPPPCL